VHEVPSSDVMVFYYCTAKEACQARKSGIISRKRFNGIPVTLRRPFMTRSNDFIVFGGRKERVSDDPALQRRRNKQQKFPNEEVLVLTLPRQFIDPLPGFEDDDGLWVLSADVLKTFKPRSFFRVADAKPWLKSWVMLPPHCIVKSFVVLDTIKHSGAENAGGNMSEDIDEDEFVIQNQHESFLTNSERESNSGGEEAVVGCPPVGYSSETNPVVHTTSSGSSSNIVLSIDVLFSIEQFVSEMLIVRQKAYGRDLVPLYHYTSRTSATLIIRNGFRVNNSGGHSNGSNGGSGSGDSFKNRGSGSSVSDDKKRSGGVFFTTRGPACYDIGSEGYESNIIQDFYGVHQANIFSNKASVEVVIVYGCCARALDKVSDL
jgi:hypothetical protein